MIDLPPRPFAAALADARQKLLALGRDIGHTPKAYVRTFGCQQNEADSERLRGVLAALGFALCENVADADCVLVNTCAIREHAEDKVLSSLGHLKLLKRAKPHMIIGVCGCMAAEAHRVEQLKTKYPYVDFSIPPAGDAALPDRICRALDKRRTLTPLAIPEPPQAVAPIRAPGHKAWVSIMYGCNNFCSYCIVPYVRGRERSRPKEDVLAECRTLIRSGMKEITLLGQNVNSYAGGCDFAVLLSEIAAIEGDFIVRFMTSHPKDVTPALIWVMAENPKIARSFHLPLQSGSDRILAKMNRKYDAAKYLSHVASLRAAMPAITISTDIIVGFPGETEEDFAATLDVVRKVRYDLFYAFIYSPRKGTPAASMPDAVDRQTANDRLERLLILQSEIAAEKNAEAIGREYRVLCEGPSKTDPTMLAGRNDGNTLILFRGNAGEGDFVRVRITETDGTSLFGEQISL